MNKFLIMPNILKEKSYSITKEIVNWLVNQNHEVYLTEKVGELYGLNSFIYNKSKAMQNADCAIVLGGDGTILHAARELAPYNLPILGVNLGHLGFLAEVDAKNIQDTLENLCLNRYFIEDRMMLDTSIIEKGQVNKLGLALNDIVVSRASITRMIGYSVYVNDELVNHFFADGIIVSTPTGSTAYNLSAGGPILAPHNEMIVITPICSHSLNDRSIVISAEDKITIKFELKRDSKDLQLTIDGQKVVSISNETEIFINKSAISTHLIKLNNINFYALLRKKLARG